MNLEYHGDWNQFCPQAKIGIDEESEATLLTALTEILDNVDDENLSPFDTLPDVELLTGQKGREHSPVSSQLLATCDGASEVWVGWGQ